MCLNDEFHMLKLHNSGSLQPAHGREGDCHMTKQESAVTYIHTHSTVWCVGGGVGGQCKGN